MKTNYRRFIVSILFSVLCFCSTQAQNHLGLSFHQSTGTRIGAFFDIEDMFIIETRVLDFVTFEELSLEFFGFYKFTSRYSSEIYAGVGYGLSPIEPLSGVILVAGANVFPFKNKNFGFHFELNPIIPELDINQPIMRVSWGLRFKFLKEEE